MSIDALRDALTDSHRIERALEQDGTATVNLAHDITHDRQVVIKVVRPKLAEDQAGAIVVVENRLQELKAKVKK